MTGTVAGPARNLALGPFPGTGGKTLSGFHLRYQVIGDNMYVEIWPLKYLGRVERLTDGVVFQNLLFVDAEGKYRIVDEGYWVGETPPIGEPFLSGSDGKVTFPVEGTKGKFLLSTEVVRGLQYLEKGLGRK
jgi:hypothetical protein